MKGSMIVVACSDGLMTFKQVLSDERTNILLAMVEMNDVPE